ncbi:MAG: hypothetical protein HY245_06185, partial [Rhizobiales bacterium]|nr:hypothetical protein [Hyphomicrobiales bacterium]
SGITVLYYNCKHVEEFAKDGWMVEFVDLGGPAELPYDRFAVIRMAPPG